jgi:Protein of unknown function (DUF3071)
MKEQDLTLVGLTEDKQNLVLVNQAGEEFTLPADARLRAALRGEHARIGQLEITMESALRPRDIQARIRAGESPESVAAAAQTTIEKIMGYATPVLAERAHVADRAQRASVRRKGSEGPARILGDAIAERLRGRNVDPESVEWDAWRREDGRWTLVADYRSGESPRHAEFVFDVPGRYVVPEDDEARWLVGEQPATRDPQARTGPGPRRLSAVGADDELPLGEDAIGMVSEERAAEEATEDLSATAAAVRAPEGSTGPSAVDEPAATGDADWIATQASERPERVELGSESDAEVAEPQAVAPDTEDPEAEQGEEPEPPRRASKKGRRASVPSWDEIMFGGGKRE